MTLMGEDPAARARRRLLVDAARLRERRLMDERLFQTIVTWVFSWEIHHALEPQLQHVQDYLLDFTEQATQLLQQNNTNTW